MTEVIYCLGGRTESRLERMTLAYQSLLKLTNDNAPKAVLARRDEIQMKLQEARNESRSQNKERILDGVAQDFAGLTLSHMWSED